MATGPTGALAGRYVLGRQLGRGSSAAVFEAWDLVLDRPVSVKLFDSALALDPALRTRFAQQTAKAASLAHPHVARVLDAGMADGPVAQPFVVTEPAGPRNLRALLDREGRLAPRRAVALARQLAAGLAHAHDRGLIHADVKPENVLVDEAGTQAKLVDFSLSFVSAATGVVTPDTIARRAAYLAPEQVRGTPVSVTTDVYGLGVLLYELVAGRPPFVASTPEATAERRVRELARPAGSFDPSIPAGLDAVLGRALQRAPERRWPSMEAFDAALAALEASSLAPAPVPLPPAEPSAPAPALPPRRTRFRLPSIVPVAVGLAALLLALAVVLPALAGVPRLVTLVPPRVEIPDLVGMPLADAQAVARARGLELRVVGERVSDRYPQGAVVQQSPVPGWQQAAVDPLRVTVSAGPSAPGPLALPATAPGVPGAVAERPATCGAGRPPRFVLGLAELKRQVGELMGEPLECERIEPASGDTVQATTTGLAYYRPRSNVPAFTDGWQHWALTERGLVTWEGESPDPPPDP